jgi:hypothetical protein
MSASTSNASSISLILNQQISYAVYHLPAGTYSLPDDSGKLSQELLIGLGLIERTSAPPTVPPPPPPSSADTDADAKSDTKSDSKKSDTKARTRTVSKKMKDAFLASPGNGITRTEDDLKRVSKAYKAATDADIAAAGGDFVSFGNRILAAPATPAASAAPAPKETKTKTVKPKEKKEKPKPRLAWSAAEKKVFKDIVTDVTDDLKAEFAAYIDAKSDDDFKAFAMAGHMRAWFDARVTITPKAGNGEFTPAEYDLARGVQNSGEVEADEDADGADEDEDLVDIDVDGEQLLIGTKTGTIYQPTEEAGDVKIGRAGEGKFKHVKIPQE